MLSLTEEQIAFIEKDIDAKGIKSLGLHVDLVDHICCVIENELDDYSNFQNVYKNTIALFGSDGLHKIQKETDRLLIFKHYYFMNSTMKISGYVSAAMILLGTTFKFYHYPGAGVMLFGGMVIMTILFLPLMFILKFKSEHEDNRSVTLSVIGAVSAILISVGILFKMLHWPWSTNLLYGGFGLMIIGYLPIYLFSAYHKTSNKINAVSTVVLLVAGASLLFASTNPRVNKVNPNILESLFSFHYSIENSADFLKKQNAITYEKIIHELPDSATSLKAIEQIRKSSDRIIGLITATKTTLISEVENISKEEASKMALSDIQHQLDNYITNKVLFGEGHSNMSGLIEELKLFDAAISEVIPNSKLLIHPDKISDEFLPLNLVFALHKLTQLELSILALETSVYSRF